MAAVNPKPLDQYDDADKRQIIAELERRPEGTSPRLVTGRYGVSPQLVMSWKQQLLEASILNGDDNEPHDPAPPTTESERIRALEIENAVLKHNLALLRTVLATVLDRL